MKPYSFHVEAERDSDQAISWHLDISSELAFALALEFQEAYRNIVEHPNRFPGHVWGTRRLVMQKFPYYIIYREQTNSIQIIAIAHHKRHPGYWKNRL